MQEIRFKTSESRIDEQIRNAFEPSNIDIKCEEVLEIELGEILDYSVRVRDMSVHSQLMEYAITLSRAIENRKLGQVLN